LASLRSCAGIDGLVVALSSFLGKPSDLHYAAPASTNEDKPMVDVISAQPGFAVLVFHPNDGGFVTREPVIGWTVAESGAFPVTPFSEWRGEKPYAVAYPDGRVVTRACSFQDEAAWRADEEQKAARWREDQKVAEEARAMDKFAKLPKG
jgi:hypothetical protein